MKQPCGKSNDYLFPEAVKLVGDRDGGLDDLRGRTWDAVIDTSGYVPRLLRDSAHDLLNYTLRRNSPMKYKLRSWPAILMTIKLSLRVLVTLTGCWQRASATTLMFIPYTTDDGIGTGDAQTAAGDRTFHVAGDPDQESRVAYIANCTVTPGTHIVCTASTAVDYTGSTVCDKSYPDEQQIIAASTGTSLAVPAVAGMASLVSFWLEKNHDIVDPSPAPVKANLISSASYLRGESTNDNLPSNNRALPCSVGSVPLAIRHAFSSIRKRCLAGRVRSGYWQCIMPTVQNWCLW